MSPRLRTHLVTAGLFAAVIAVMLLVWSLRNVFVYVLLGVVALLVYWGLYLLVSSRLRHRAEEQGDRREEGE
jgi:Ca2+/Na+ antiporter